MTEPMRRSIIVVLTLVSLTCRFSRCETRYYVKIRENSTNPLGKLMTIINEGRSVNEANNERRFGNVNADRSTRSRFRIDDVTMIRESLKANLERRNSFIESSTFDPDVLNKFLDDYANKIKSTTERNNFDFSSGTGKPEGIKFNGQIDDITSLDNVKDPRINETMENSGNSTLDPTGLSQQDLNDTIKRNKYVGGNANDDRNGWVTLEAIPWSKSKISKWQASSSSQRPWPEMKIWEKPNSGKPWDTEFPSRPAYINNEPWHETPKPLRPDYHSDRPTSRPQAPSRPSYFDDRYDDNSNQAQKWPPERPQSSWEKFPSANSYRPNIEIITDDRPSNFPNNWNKYTHTTNNNNNNNNNKPTYSYNDRDRYTSNDNNENKDHYHHDNRHQVDDWRDSLSNYPSKFENYKDKPTNFGRPINDNRPQHISHYQYTPDHPPSHPSSGEGQWVLLSTNRGYSKSRQRSINVDNADRDMVKTSTANNGTIPTRTTKQDNDGTIAVMTSKRQVRLTVLPSINGTNTTTSHGGLLEVEKTFKTVDQSQREYEKSKEQTSIRPMIVNNRPIRNTIVGRPSNSAVLAAIGAGMVPATMAMMIPIMLGRKKRSNTKSFDEIHRYNRHPPEKTTM